MSHLKKITICAMCVALCCVLPVAFHALALGIAFSPMHLPVLLCGLLCGWPYGLFCGVAGPVLSCLISSMPGPAQLLTMVPELAVYGLATGILMKVIRTGHVSADLYLSMVPAMLLGRIVGGVAQAIVYLSGARSYSMGIWAGAYLVGTAPGAVLQLVVLPVLVLILMRTGLVPPKYPAEKGEKTA